MPRPKHPAAPPPSVNLSRLQRRLVAVNEFGADPSRPGVHRPSFSPADMAARRWLMDEMTALGLEVRLDAVGNVIGRWQTGTGPAVMLGSHLDSVPSGGRFDGALGVIAALECIHACMDHRIEPDSPIEVVATSEEEGRFGGMLGAQAMAGTVDRQWFDDAVDENGVRLVDAMAAAGFDPADHAAAHRRPGEIGAFLELHIEQGPVLEHARRTIGIVEGISGVFNWAVAFEGEANHAGTTPMNLRRDSFRGLVEFAHGIDAIIAEAGTPATRLTIGKVDLSPNYPHTVPGRTEFVLIGRDLDLAVMTSLAGACRERLRRAADAHDLDMTIAEASWLPPTRCHADIVAAFSRQAERLGLDAIVMPSGAGHDTQVMAGCTRAGMIFVPSLGGVSHAPEEYTDPADIEAGANLLLATLLDVAAAG